MEAIRAVQRTGGLSKINPNRVRPDPEKRKSLKRPIDTDDTEGNVNIILPASNTDNVRIESCVRVRC